MPFVILERKVKILNKGIFSFVKRRIKSISKCLRGQPQKDKDKDKEGHRVPCV